MSLIYACEVFEISVGACKWRCPERSGIYGRVVWNNMRDLEVLLAN